MEYHVPVLLEACLNGLRINPDGTYIDATFGGGGHSRAILELLGDEGRLFAFDRDAEAVANQWIDNRLKVIQTNYKNIERFMRLEGVTEVDGILADLGVSSHQINEAERGFSFRYDAPLDMRMNQGETLTAEQVVNTYSPTQLQQMFSQYGEVRNARTLASHLVKRRGEVAVQTTGQLRALAEEVAGGPVNKYLAKVFQAIRIEVNGELEAIKEFVIQAKGLLRKGGRLVVMSYHSLEDRLVKNYFRGGVFEGEPVKDLYGRTDHDLKLITRKVVQPTEGEIKENPRARSARLRIAEKI